MSDNAPAQTDQLPAIDTALDAGAVLERLEKLAKRGKLAGFRRLSDRSFGVSAFGSPFDREMVGTVESGRVSFELVWKRAMPAAFLVTLIVSVWPGVHLMDSLMNTWFGWYPNAFWVTCAWYIPLTALPAPWAWKVAMNRSRAGSDEHARETIDKIRDALGA